MSQVLLVLLGTFLCIGIGVAMGHTMASRGREAKRADAVQKDFDEYKAEVKEHFAQTAEHFQTIGREYRALYDHMAIGANSLLDLKEADGQLSFDPQPAVEDADAGQDAEQVVAEPAEETVEAEAVSEFEAEVEVEAAKEETEEAAEIHEDSTPDERARAAGHESAPAGDKEVLEEVTATPEAAEEVDEVASAEAAEPEADEASDVEASDVEVAEVEVIAADVEAVDAGEESVEEAADDTPEVLVDESAKKAEDAEHTYH